MRTEYYTSKDFIEKAKELLGEPYKQLPIQKLYNEIDEIIKPISLKSSYFSTKKVFLEKENLLKFYIFAPFVGKEDIKSEINNGFLKVSFEKEHEIFGTHGFEKSFELPQKKIYKVDAKLENSVLTIEVFFEPEKENTIKINIS